MVCFSRIWGLWSCISAWHLWEHFHKMVSTVLYWHVGWQLQQVFTHWEKNGLAGRERDRNDRKERARERETYRGHARAGRSWPICSSELPLQAIGHVFPQCFSLKERSSSESTHTVIELHTHTNTHTHCMHIKPCLICKGKLRVMPAVPAADCCHASLPSLLQAQTMTTQHQDTPEHQNGVSSGLEDSQLQLSSNMLL